jgi:cytochrome oxidase Cu insertion factor (SCO1/SenC/PrrC family)
MSALDMASSRRLPWGLLVLALLLPAVLVLRDVARSRAARPAEVNADGLDDFGVVPDFSLVERSGRELKRADLAGAPWLADFVYTSCAGACPRLSSDMARLHHRLGERVRLVSFTVDPARDSPRVLADYAERFGASPTGWLFATGPIAPMRQLISKGFHLAVIDPPASDPELAGVITHSEKIVLVDASLRIRRYYDAGSTQWLDRAVADLAKLGASPPRSRQ